MSSISSIYANTLHDNLKILYANWEPTAPVSLGDYGVMVDNLFHRLGNIAEYDVTFTTLLGATASYEFTSKSGVEVDFSVGGAAGGVKAGLQIKFDHENGVFFNAAGCKTSQIGNLAQVGAKLIALHQAGKWNRDYHVVTHLVAAGATTIIISGSSNASITLEAKSPTIDRIELSDASIGLSIKSHKNIGLKIVAAEGLTPLFGLGKVDRIFGALRSTHRDSFQVHVTMTDHEAGNRDDSVTTTIAAEELIFDEVK